MTHEWHELATPLRLAYSAQWFPAHDDLLHPSVAAHLWQAYFRHFDSSETKADAELASFLQSLPRPPAAITLRTNPLLVGIEMIVVELRSALSEAADVDLSALEVRPHRFVAGCIEIVRQEAAQPLEPRPRAPICSERASVLVTSKCGESVLRGQSKSADVYMPGVLGTVHLPGCSSGFASSTCACFNPGARVAVIAVFGGKRSEAVENVTERRYVGCGVVVHNLHPVAERSGVAVRITGRTFNTCPPVPLATLPQKIQTRIFAQNLPCIICGLVLDPRPHETVVDLCAGPGGKTTHLAQLMANTGLVFAIDASSKRAAAVRALCTRFGVTNVLCKHADARELGRSLCLPPAFVADDAGRRRADRCLVDPPCSGLGDRPRFRNAKTLQALHALIPHQRNLVEAAVRVLKRPGGILVYSTCTVNPAENERQTRWILDTFPFLRLVPQEPCLHGRAAVPGLRGHGLDDEERLLVQRFEPQGPGDTVGFFISKFMAT